MVACREQSGHEDGRLSRGCELPHRAPGARKHEVARPERRTELFGERIQPVVEAAHPLLQLVVVARSREVEDGRALRAECLDRELVQESRAERSAEYEQHRPGVRQTEDSPAFGLRTRT